MLRKNTILLAGISTLALGSLAHADLAGFSGFTTNSKNGNGVSINGANTDLTITDSNPAGSEGNSAYSTTPQSYANGFTAQFVYTDTNPGGFNGGPADGFSFILQNAGLTAVGTVGGGVGYDSIGSSAAIVGKNFQGSTTNFATNGTEGTTFNTAPVAFNTAASPVTETLVYDPVTNGGQITETLVQGGNSFTHIFPTGNLATELNSGANGSPTTALVGFTGGTGGAWATQDITSFTYTASAVPEPSTWVAAGGLLLLAVGDFRRRLKA